MGPKHGSTLHHFVRICHFILALFTTWCRSIVFRQDACHSKTFHDYTVTMPLEKFFNLVIMHCTHPCSWRNICMFLKNYMFIPIITWFCAPIYVYECKNDGLLFVPGCFHAISLEYAVGPWKTVTKALFHFLFAPHTVPPIFNQPALWHVAKFIAGYNVKLRTWKNCCA